MATRFPLQITVGAKPCFLEPLGTSKSPPSTQAAISRDGRWIAYYAAERHLVVVLNWAEELKRLVP